MAKYINGHEIETENTTRNVVTEEEAIKYYPKFRGNPNAQQVNVDKIIIYDGGDTEG